MSNDVFSLGCFRDLHDFKISTSKKRTFIANIFKEPKGYSGDLVILDGISERNIQINFKTVRGMAEDVFLTHLDNIGKYLEGQGDDDFITEIHNPCNTPFISLKDQQIIVNNQGINVAVTVN